MPIDPHEISNPRADERYVTVHNIEGECVAYSTVSHREDATPSLTQQIRDLVKDLPEGNYLATRVYVESDIDRIGISVSSVSVSRPHVEIEVR